MARRGVNKTTVYKSGGTEHVAYMTREEALRAPVLEREGREHEREGRGRVHERGGSPVEEPGRRFDDSPLLVWNMPAFVTGEELTLEEDTPGRRKGKGQARVRHEITGQRMPLREKIENVRAYVGGKLELEESLGGPTHHRTVLTVGGSASVEALKAAVIEYLLENYPRYLAVVAIHRDTKYLHAHVLVLTRGTDGRRLDLGQRFFKLDESWMSIASRHFKDPDIYKTHFLQKAETKAWKERYAEALRGGKPVPPKPDRHRDHWEVWHSFRPHDDFWVGRVRHCLKVRLMRLEYQSEAGRPPAESAQTRGEVAVLKEKYEAAAKRRSARRVPSRDKSPRPTPREVPTVSESREITYYARELKRLRTERLQSHFAVAVEEYKIGLSPVELRHLSRNPEAYDARARDLAARLHAVAAEKGVDLKRTSLDADAVLEIARAALDGEIARDYERRGAHLRDRAELPAAAAQRAERVGRALGSVLHQEIRCKFQEELVAGRGGGADRDELLLARHELGLAKERLAVAREQSRRPGLEEGPVRPLLTEAKEADIVRMLDAIGDAGFRKAYREKLMQSGLIHEEVHDRVRVR